MSERKLQVFISSTADLKEMRDAVEHALADLNIDGSRFESWPSSPNDPISECLQRIEECDALVLVLGARFGSTTKDGISVTQSEYRHANKCSKPIFAYILDLSSCEEKQKLFIKEVEEQYFRSQKIKNASQLILEVRRSFLNEFVRCFKKEHSFPPIKPSSISSPINASYNPTLPATADDTLQLLHQLYERQDELVIQSLSEQCEQNYGTNPKIMNILYANEVNLGINDFPFSKERVSRAIDFWLDLYQSLPANAAVLTYNLGNAYLALKRYDSAIAKYKSCLSLKENHPECWKNLAGAYLEKGQNELAISCLKRALAYNPQLWEALYSLATIAITEEKDYDSALDYLNRIRLIGIPLPKLSDIFGWMAIAFKEKGKLEQSVAKIEDALMLNPDVDWAWKSAGRIYSLLRNYNQSWLNFANYFWDRFLSKYPYIAEAWYEKGFICWFIRNKEEKDGYAEKALTAFLEAVKLGIETDGLVWDRIGHLYQEKSNLVEAEKAFQKAASLNEKEFGYCYGVSLISIDRYGEALPLVLAQAEKYHKDHKSWFQVGICYEKINEPEKAISAYKRAIELCKDYPEAWFNLGRFFWNSGMFIEAKEVWKEAINRFPDSDLSKNAKEFLEKQNDKWNSSK